MLSISQSEGASFVSTRELKILTSSSKQIITEHFVCTFIPSINVELALASMQTPQAYMLQCKFRRFDALVQIPQAQTYIPRPKRLIFGGAPSSDAASRPSGPCLNHRIQEAICRTGPPSRATRQADKRSCHWSPPVYRYRRARHCNWQSLRQQEHLRSGRSEAGGLCASMRCCVTSKVRMPCFWSSNTTLVLKPVVRG